ncbi:LuxR C-terminal-related transcriptional regulator [Nocardia sp. CNY236]|uniref:LuxR C-terminal-related transcriptional regulator n=1 Tax=Nocardia sp. CNY236 TaxID=1169152 RepID=UPI00040353A7|nr:LuxR C-terminal-related transcriptional regulator [Nocardia sp. CNY236]
MTDIAFDTLPYARDIFRDLDSANKRPAVYLIRGRSQTGKSTLLAEIRTRLRAHGVPVHDDTTLRHDMRNGAVTATDLPRATGNRPADRPADTLVPVLVVDNGHLLSAGELEYLRAAVASGHRSVIVAAQPRPHDKSLRMLADTIARHGRIVRLRPLGIADIPPFARELGLMVPRPVIQHIHTQTAGIRGGVVAALAAACSARLRAGTAAVDAAVATWVRGLLDDLELDLMDTLVVATTGTGLDTSELAVVLGVEHATAQDLIDRARASALVTDADLLLEPAVAPLRTLLGERRFVAVARRLLGARLEAGLLRNRTAVQLAESGVRDPRLAEFLITAAEESERDAVGYYNAAAAAGADRDPITLRWAEAAARTGDSETAMRLAEPMLARSGIAGADLATAVRICAVVLTRRGLTGRAAQLYTWLGPDRVGPDWAVAATVLRVAGDAAGAEAMSRSAAQWPPTEASAQASLIAAALADSLESGDGSGAAVSTLMQAARADGDSDHFLACTAVAIATLLSLGSGEPYRAADALRRASARGLRCGHLDVLAAWTAMYGGDERAAAATLATLNQEELDVRVQLLAHGVAAGLARRNDNHIALARIWQAARPLFDDVQADLLLLLPIGELWLAGIRIRDEQRIASLVDAAREMLRQIAEPPAWSNIFHWYGAQAAIAHGNLDELRTATRPLQAAAEAGNRHAATLTDASRAWTQVLGGDVPTAPVQAAAAALAGIGMHWDGAQLATEAARTVPDTAMAHMLVDLARTIHPDTSLDGTSPRPAASSVGDGGIPGSTSPIPRRTTLLSDREREVAELVLLGLTYREIGARLYISAKTVEHHVARIRRRVGARSRSELLSMLRAMGHGPLPV